MQIVRLKSDQVLYPVDFLEKALLKYYPDVDFELYCEPFFKEGKPHWAFDNYRCGFDLTSPSPLFYTQPGFGKTFEVYGRENIKCVTYACDPDTHIALDSKKIYDVGFIGELKDDISQRRQYIEVIDENFNAFLSNDILTKDLSKIYSQCKVIFNHIRTEEINIRFFEGLALGAMVCSYSPALHLFAEEGKHYLTFKTPEEAVEKIKFLLENDDVREKMAKEAREHVMKNHTYKHRAEEMLRFMGKVL